MPKRPKVLAGVAAEESLLESPEGNPLEEEKGNASLFDFSGDARVRTYRRDTTTQKWVIHGYFPATATEEDISREFGGGEYWVQLMLPDRESGRESISTSRKFRIPGPYRPPQTDLPGIRREGAPLASGATPAATVGTMPSGMSDMMGVLNATVMSTFIDLLKTFKEASNRPAPTMDPMLVEILKAQAGTQQKIIEMIITLSAKDGGDSKKEVLQMMESMKGLLTPAVSPGNPMEMFNSMLQAFTSMRDVADDLAPPRGGTGDPLMDSLPKLVEVVAEQHQMSKRQRMGVPPSATLTPVVSTESQPTLALWQRILRSQGRNLVSSASRGISANTAALVAIEYAPQDVIGVFQEFFNRDPDAVVADMIREVPPLAAFPAWARSFVDEAKTMLFEDEEEGETQDTIGDVEGEAQS